MIKIISAIGKQNRLKKNQKGNKLSSETLIYEARVSSINIKEESIIEITQLIIKNLISNLKMWNEKQALIIKIES